MTLLIATEVVVGMMIVCEIAFTALPAARRIIKEHQSGQIRFPMDWVIALVALEALGTIGDVIFNVFRGTFIFGELPKEWFFTHRIQRYCDYPEQAPKNKGGLVIGWALRLNVVDPTHIVLGRNR